MPLGCVGTSSGCEGTSWPADVPPTHQDAAALRVVIALCMVTAPFAFERRQEVRASMLRYEPVVRGRMAFKFVVGNHLPTLPKSDPSARRNVELLQQEIHKDRDVLRLDAIDGPKVDNACSCVEKMAAWVQYALRAYPGATFIGKTEDDTYVQLHVLEGELMALRGHANVQYGYHTLSLMPARPTQRPEAKPEKACVTRAGDCRWSQRCPGARKAELCDKSSGRGGAKGRGGVRGRGAGRIRMAGRRLGDAGLLGRLTATGGRRLYARDQRQGFDAPHRRTAGCFLGDMEDKLLVDAETGVLQVWPAVLGDCGDKSTFTAAPFPTGPLVVWGRDLARTIFEDCAYLERYLREGREYNRKTECRRGRGSDPVDYTKSFATTLCDSVVGHWTAMCATSPVTIAHMTRSKAHHYNHRAGGLGWMAPSNLSVSIHGLKAHAAKPSGPNSTVGGEWAHVHETVRHATAPAFPSLLWRQQHALNYSKTLLDTPPSMPLLTPLNPYVFEWHMQSCSFARSELKRAMTERAERMSAAAHGFTRPREKRRQTGKSSDATFLGGNPVSWGWSGCNPSRFRGYPVWPPPADWPSHTQVFIEEGEDETATVAAPAAEELEGAERGRPNVHDGMIAGWRAARDAHGRMATLEQNWLDPRVVFWGHAPDARAVDAAATRVVRQLMRFLRQQQRDTTTTGTAAAAADADATAATPAAAAESVGVGAGAARAGGASKLEATAAHGALTLISEAVRRVFRNGKLQIGNPTELLNVLRHRYRFHEATLRELAALAAKGGANQSQSVGVGGDGGAPPLEQRMLDAPPVRRFHRMLVRAATAQLSVEAKMRSITDDAAPIQPRYCTRDGTFTWHWS